MLVLLGVLAWEEATPVMQHFDQLDARKRGRLFPEDFEAAARSRLKTAEDSRVHRAQHACARTHVRTRTRTGRHACGVLAVEDARTRSHLPARDRDPGRILT